MPMIDTDSLVVGFYDPPHPPPNPAFQQAEDKTIRWLYEIGFLKTAEQERHVRSFQFGLYHGLATPHVDLSHLMVGLKWFFWGSLADDQYDNYDRGDRRARLRGVLREVRGVVYGKPDEVVPDNPIIAGLADYWPQLTAGMSARRRARISQNFIDYLEAIELQNKYHAAGEVPDVATFLMMRRHTIAMVFQADVLEVVSQIDVPDRLRDSLPFREMIWCFADVTAWHNDVYGLEKDIQDGQTCNAVRVFAADHNCSLSDATDLVLELAQERQRLFLDIQDELPTLAEDLGLPSEAAIEGLKLSHDLRAYAYANLAWIQQTQRYDIDVPRIRGTFDDVLDH